MKLEPPQPPTAPAPAIRPTPPTPPRIDKAPFVRDNGQGTTDNGVDGSPEYMARDAVAHGSGPLTKREVNKGDSEMPRQTFDSELVKDTQSDYDRGQDVLREFQALDARESSSSYNPPAQTSTEQLRTPAPKLNHHEGNGVAFWIFTIIFVAVTTIFIVKKFLLTDKPALTKSQLFDDDKKMTATKSPPKPPVPSPKSPAPEKGKRFEVRI